MKYLPSQGAVSAPRRQLAGDFVRLQVSPPDTASPPDTMLDVRDHAIYLTTGKPTVRPT